MSRPTYQGRPLPRPNEEVVDQGLQFDLTTVLHRRGMLRLIGVGFGAAALAACTNESAGSSASPAASGSATGSSSDLTEIPDETNGPYPADGTNGPDILEQSGVVRQDIRSSFGTSTTTAEGIPLTFTLKIIDMANDDSAFAGAAVYAWHCDRAGGYSMYSEGLENENYLRGVQIADEEGTVSFTSIFPACYTRRWPHIHFEVYPDEASITDHDQCISTSQLALPKEACDAVYATTGYEQSVNNLSQLSLDTDNVFGDDGGEHQLGTITGSVADGYQVSLDVPVDTETEPTSGSAPGGGDGSPGGAPPSGGPGGEPPSGGPSGGPPSTDG